MTEQLSGTLDSVTAVDMDADGFATSFEVTVTTAGEGVLTLAMAAEHSSQTSPVTLTARVLWSRATRLWTRSTHRSPVSSVSPSQTQVPLTPTASPAPTAWCSRYRCRNRSMARPSTGRTSIHAHDEHGAEVIISDAVLTVMDGPSGAATQVTAGEHGTLYVHVQSAAFAELNGEVALDLAHDAGFADPAGNVVDGYAPVTEFTDYELDNSAEFDGAAGRGQRAWT